MAECKVKEELQGWITVGVFAVLYTAVGLPYVVVQALKGEGKR